MEHARLPHHDNLQSAQLGIDHGIGRTHSGRIENFSSYVYYVNIGVRGGREEGGKRHRRRLFFRYGQVGGCKHTEVSIDHSTGRTHS